MRASSAPEASTTPSSSSAGRRSIASRAVVPLIAAVLGAAVSLLGFGSPVHADPATISGAIQFPAGANAPDIATSLDLGSSLPDIAVFDRGDDEIHYEILAVHGNESSFPTALSWDVDTSQLRWTLAPGAPSSTYTFAVFWSRWVYTGPIPKQVDSRQFWLATSSTDLLGSMAKATTYTVGTSPLQFHCAYGFEGCAAGGGGNAPEVIPGTPKISGTAQVGKKLTASAGSWQPAGTRLGYQWLRDGKTIAKANANAYVPTATDAGRRLSVRVTGTLPGYTSASATSAQTSAVARGRLSAPTPKISGTAKVGRTLTAKPGVWRPAGVKLSYQWYAGGKKIAKATRPSYRISQAAKGKKITVKVTGVKSGYSVVTQTSAATKQVSG